MDETTTAATSVAAEAPPSASARSCALVAVRSRLVPDSVLSASTVSAPITVDAMENAPPMLNSEIVRRDGRGAVGAGAGAKTAGGSATTTSLLGAANGTRTNSAFSSTCPR